jgi:hypothetical protein
MASKKRRRYMKVELLETSAVGTPAYPDAHFSFIKSLAHSIKKEDKDKMPEVEVKSQEAEVVETKATEVEAEKSVEVEVEAKEEVEAEPEAEDKSAIVEAIKELQSAIKELSVQRGLVAEKEDTSVKDMMKNASIGELAIASGFFQA